MDTTLILSSVVCLLPLGFVLSLIFPRPKELRSPIVAAFNELQRHPAREAYCLRTSLVAIALFCLASETFAATTNEYLWATQLGGKKNAAATAMAVDQSGNIYVTGMAGNKTYHSIGTHLWHSSGGDMFLAKFSPDGKLLWRKDAGGDGIDSGNAVAVNKKGDVYVTGSFTRTLKFGKTSLKAALDKSNHDYYWSDIFLARYDSNGNLIWVRQAGGTLIDHPNGVAVDEDGNACITGYFQGKARFGSIILESKTHPDKYHDPDTDYGDVFVTKYDSAGNALWARQAGDEALNVGHGIALDAADNVYITDRFARCAGIFANTTHFDRIAITSSNCNFVAKYDRDGNILWAQPTAGVGQLEFVNDRIAVDRSNNVFIAGSFTFTQPVGNITLAAPNGNNELFLAKYDTDGHVLWAKQAGGPSHDDCEGLAVDNDGNAYITGCFEDIATFSNLQIHAKPHNPYVSGYESFIACYRSNGDVAWVTTLDRNANMHGIAVDSAAHVIALGDFEGVTRLGNIQLKSRVNFWGKRQFDTFLAKRRAE